MKKNKPITLVSGVLREYQDLMELREIELRWKRALNNYVVGNLAAKGLIKLNKPTKKRKEGR